MSVRMPSICAYVCVYTYMQIWKMKINIDFENCTYSLSHTHTQALILAKSVGENFYFERKFNNFL